MAEDVALPAFLTPAQLAEYLQVPLDSVKRWRKYGTGPVGHRIGKHVRYARADVAAWLEAQRDTPRPTPSPARLQRAAVTARARRGGPVRESARRRERST